MIKLEANHLGGTNKSPLGTPQKYREILSKHIRTQKGQNSDLCQGLSSQPTFKDGIVAEVATTKGLPKLDHMKVTKRGLLNQKKHLADKTIKFNEFQLPMGHSFEAVSDNQL